MPALESDLDPDEYQDLSGLTLLTDLDLWKVAHGTMNDQKQTELEALAEWQKSRSLTETEQSQLSTLMAEAQKTMLRKAEAYHLLAMRGHASLGLSNATMNYTFRKPMSTNR